MKKRSISQPRVRNTTGESARDQLSLAFQLALGRPATKTELSRMQGLLTDTGASEAGLIAVCRVLLNANEFVYVD